MEILDGLDGVYLRPPADFALHCGDAAGCYEGGRIHFAPHCGADGCYESGRIHVLWVVEDYNDQSAFLKKATFNKVFSTFIHEFMHAIYYQDLEYQDLELRGSWLCWSRNTAFGEFRVGVENETFRQYTQCLDDSNPLFRQLRDFHDDLPPDSEFGCSYRHLTNINGRWGGLYSNSHQRHTPAWYAELYAESVLIRDLPPELENHYSQYFKNRLEIPEISPYC